MTPRRVLFGVGLGLVATFHARSALPRQAATVVAGENERPRPHSEPRGLRADELGRLYASRDDAVVSESWVPLALRRRTAMRAVEPGLRLQFCRSRRPCSAASLG